MKRTAPQEDDASAILVRNKGARGIVFGVR
jgi:hypothetical protein